MNFGLVVNPNSKKIDSLGNINTINFPNKGIDILKLKELIIMYSNCIQYRIYRYDIDESIFIEKSFLNLKINASMI